MVNGLYSKYGSSIEVNLLVNSIEPHSSAEMSVTPISLLVPFSTAAFKPSFVTNRGYFGSQ